MVDELTNAKGPAVLVSQIQAGGVGLNVQAASVVIIAEPQLTPSSEEQAIARAHRMGQVRPVDVHRLLCEDSVDQRVLELLADKREAFDEYARRSDMANAVPDAVDTSSEAELRHAIVAAERQAPQGGVTNGTRGSDLAGLLQGGAAGVDHQAGDHVRVDVRVGRRSSM